MRVFHVSAGPASPNSTRLPDGAAGQRLPVDRQRARASSKRHIGDVAGAPAALGPAASWSTCTSPTCSTTSCPRHYDYTSWYDLLVFRRLAAGSRQRALFADDDSQARRRLGAACAGRASTPARSALRVFDRVLLTVHPADCAVRELLRAAPAAARRGRQRGARRGAPADQPGRPDAAHGQPHGRQLPRPAPRC